MKSVLIDASSAILLYKAGMFDAVARAYRLLVVPAVMGEITVPGQPGALAFRRAHQRQHIVQLSHQPKIEPDRRLPSMGIGERDTLLAFARGVFDFIIIDDGKGAQVCRKEAIPYINALLCPKIMLWAGRIDAPFFEAAFERLQRIGRYSAKIIDFARASTPEMLMDFHPTPCRSLEKRVYSD